jgi:hypothetical protein
LFFVSLPLPCKCLELILGKIGVIFPKQLQIVKQKNNYQIFQKQYIFNALFKHMFLNKTKLYHMLKKREYHFGQKGTYTPMQVNGNNKGEFKKKESLKKKSLYFLRLKTQRETNGESVAAGPEGDGCVVA